MTKKNRRRLITPERGSGLAKLVRSAKPALHEVSLTSRKHLMACSPPPLAPLPRVGEREPQSLGFREAVSYPVTPFVVLNGTTQRKVDRGVPGAWNQNDPGLPAPSLTGRFASPWISQWTLLLQVVLPSRRARGAG
jgi:hypothetical protein